MALDDLDGIANVQFEQVPIVTWGSAQEWDNAVDESFVSHPSGTITMKPGIDSFEDLSNTDSAPSGWNFSNASVTNNYASDGNLSISNGSGSSTIMQTDVNQTPEQTISFAFRETTSSGGISYWLENESGNTILECGTSNPDHGFYSGNGYTCIGNFSYEEWYRFEITFDWSNDQFDIDHIPVTSSESSSSYTGEPFPNSSSEISKVYLGNRNDVWCSTGGTDPSATEWIDEIYGVPSYSYLETTAKTIGSSSTPSFVELSYNLNSNGRIVLTAIGSPGTDSEESISQELDGASEYSLSWSNSHSDFRVLIEMYSNDRSTSPSLSSVSLEG